MPPHDHGAESFVPEAEVVVGEAAARPGQGVG